MRSSEGLSDGEDASFNIQELPKGTPLPPIQRSFRVTELVQPDLKQGEFSWSLMTLEEPFLKAYPAPQIEELSPGYVVFYAHREESVSGLIILQPHWTGFIEIWDVAVQPQDRGRGVGRALLKHSQDWVKHAGYPGLRAETQDTNAPACRLYSRAGFELSGVDQRLYSQLPGVSHERALLWYWLRGKGSNDINLSAPR
jgi:ribosomal protein S18 acetylase RimI-like enzyme